MELSVEKRERLLELASEAREILGECVGEDGQAMRFEQLEEECVQAGDLIATAMLQQRVRQQDTPQETPCCPTCQRAGKPLQEQEPRVLQTDRGEVTWLETAYECRHCRRSFFPSLGRVGRPAGRHREPARVEEDRLCGDDRDQLSRR